ncbi:MAG: glycosyltransferase [Candidatus Levyibacteriota bacterium]
MSTKEIEKCLGDLNILIATHTRTTGLSQVLKEWLLSRSKEVVFIGHPLYPDRYHNSEMEIYREGKLLKRQKSSFLIKSGILLYLKDACLTFYYVWKCKNKIDLAIGVDNLNTAVLLILKNLGRIRKVVYHTVDYAPNRFKNKILNNIYHAIDRWCCYNADIIWNSSARMNDGRVKIGADKRRIAKTIITPDGSNFDPKKRLPTSRIDRNLIAFVGHLRERLGLELLITAFADVLVRVKDVRLLIIGDGPMLKDLQKLAKELKISENVTFTGFIEKHEDIDEKLRKASIGIAMFEPLKDSYEYYSDAGKPKVYLAAGLPVIITSVPEIAQEIDEKEAGILIDYDRKELANAIIKLLGENKIYLKYRKNAIELSKKYIWQNIFSSAFSQTLRYFYG